MVFPQTAKIVSHHITHFCGCSSKRIKKDFELLSIYPKDAMILAFIPNFQTYSHFQRPYR